MTATTIPLKTEDSDPYEIDRWNANEIDHRTSPNATTNVTVKLLPVNVDKFAEVIGVQRYSKGRASLRKLVETLKVRSIDSRCVRRFRYSSNSGVFVDLFNKFIRCFHPFGQNGRMDYNVLYSNHRESF